MGTRPRWPIPLGNNEISNWVFGGIASDNGLKGTDAGDQPEQSFIERYEFLTINGHVNNKWRGLYLGVARANDVINTVQGEIPGLTEDESAAQIHCRGTLPARHLSLRSAENVALPPYTWEMKFRMFST